MAIQGQRPAPHAERDADDGKLAGGKGLKTSILAVDDRQCARCSVGFDPVAIDVGDLPEACRLHRRLGGVTCCQTLPLASIDSGLHVGFTPSSRLALHEKRNRKPEQNTSSRQQPCTGPSGIGDFSQFQQGIIRRCGAGAGTKDGAFNDEDRWRRRPR